MGDNDIGKIYDAIGKVNTRLIAIETKQEERHQVNLEQMSLIKGIAQSVEKHCNEIGNLNVHKGIHYFLITVIIAAIIGVAIRGM